jgi:hypothetical protein
MARHASMRPRLSTLPHDAACAAPGAWRSVVAHHYTRAVPRLIALAALACASGVATAEPTPPVPAGRRLSPRSDAVLASCTATLNAELAAYDFRLRAGVPLLRGDGYGVALLGGYGATRLDVALPDLEPELTLHRFEAILGGGAAIAAGWSLRGSFGLAHSSDLRDSTWSALQVTSSAMAHHVLGPADAVIVGIIYSQSAELSPVLPILGYVHQREASPFRIDIFLPHHVRAEYELTPRLRGALAIETAGSTWVLQMGPAERRARRAGGSLFGEIDLSATQLVRLEARLGLSIDRYTLPQLDGSPREQPLRAAAIAQLSILIVP